VTSEQSTATGTESAESIRHALMDFLMQRLGTTVAVDQDLFASGLVNSMFAMELVVRVEELFDVEVIGSDLQLVNFRSVKAMTELVLRLRSSGHA
jgi:methoxymalonate biosynthesis acyl carrier protein